VSTERTKQEAYHEWDDVLKWAEEYVLTERGYYELRLLFYTDAWAKTAKEAALWQESLYDLQKIADQDVLWTPLQELACPLSSIEQLSETGLISSHQMYLISLWMEASLAWSDFPKERLPTNLKPLVYSFFHDAKLSAKMKKWLNSEGQISDQATQKLEKLTHELFLIKEDAISKLKSVSQEWQKSGWLQDQFSDQEDGRIVLPVKSGALSQTLGNVVRFSMTEATAFVEPESLAPYRVRLERTRAEIKAEKQRVLEEACQAVRPHTREITDTTEHLGRLDATRAKVLYGRCVHAQPIQVKENFQFSFTDTAHPLLFKHKPESEITKNSMTWPEKSKALLITGPNTGGKTVFLKTLALAAISARTGFPFPGLTRPIVPFLNKIAIDVGDTQDLGQNLSTFAGHIARFKEFLEESDSSSLLLVDEFNTATDPEEGSALSRAILEAWIERGAHIVATTHDPKLKLLGMNHPDIWVASMRFDERTRSPTYALNFGVVGNSRALETAKRLGLPDAIIKKAETYLSAAHVQFEKSLRQLEDRLSETEAAKKDADRRLAHAKTLEEEFSRKLNHELSEILEKSKVRMKRTYEQMTDTLQARFRSESSAQGTQKNRALLNTNSDQIMRELLTKSKQDLSALSPVLSTALDSLGIADVKSEEALKIGDRVIINSIRSEGVILEILPNNRFKIASGLIKMQAYGSDLSKSTSSQSAATENKPSKTAAKAYTSSLFGDPSLPTTLDLRGTRFEEAMHKLERFLDHHAQDPNTKDVTIIHGLGSGALREGTQSLLKSLPYVTHFRDADASNGGTGATIVTL